ncbi:hypothetical protein HYH03_005925 [Edaphochlamys debaryana]|uniref:Uncharacterized protein n=1 Tax=Edaphochlamys debaryana TaxID=47281 RepID=A0A836C1V4_9CHLO|nr:hypothetical protein HYH03_005925 [Edaphochlamys debaryana]|eukprot:KAG2496003.1 hypothetical protein HYH03_005925 [Edaphochlamys debaryana]
MRLRPAGKHSSKAQDPEVALLCERVENFGRRWEVQAAAGGTSADRACLLSAAKATSQLAELLTQHRSAAHKGQTRHVAAREVPWAGLLPALTSPSAPAAARALALPATAAVAAVMAEVIPPTCCPHLIAVLDTSPSEWEEAGGGAGGRAAQQLAAGAAAASALISLVPSWRSAVLMPYWQAGNGTNRLAAHLGRCAAAVNAAPSLTAGSGAAAALAAGPGGGSGPAATLAAALRLTHTLLRLGGGIRGEVLARVRTWLPLLLDCLEAAAAAAAAAGTAAAAAGSASAAAAVDAAREAQVLALAALQLLSGSNRFWAPIVRPHSAYGGSAGGMSAPPPPPVLAERLMAALAPHLGWGSGGARQAAGQPTAALTVPPLLPAAAALLCHPGLWSSMAADAAAEAARHRVLAAALGSMTAAATARTAEAAMAVEPLLPLLAAAVLPPPVPYGSKPVEPMLLPSREAWLQALVPTLALACAPLLTGHPAAEASRLRTPGAAASSPLATTLDTGLSASTTGLGSGSGSSVDGPQLASAAGWVLLRRLAPLASAEQRQAAAALAAALAAGRPQVAAEGAEALGLAGARGLLEHFAGASEAAAPAEGRQVAVGLAALGLAPGGRQSGGATWRAMQLAGALAAVHPAAGAEDTRHGGTDGPQGRGAALTFPPHSTAWDGPRRRLFALGSCLTAAGAAAASRRSQPDAGAGAGGGGDQQPVPCLQAQLAQHACLLAVLRVTRELPYSAVRHVVSYVPGLRAAVTAMAAGGPGTGASGAGGGGSGPWQGSDQGSDSEGEQHGETDGIGGGGGRDGGEAGGRASRQATGRARLVAAVRATVAAEAACAAAAVLSACYGVLRSARASPPGSGDATLGDSDIADDGSCGDDSDVGNTTALDGPGMAAVWEAYSDAAFVFGSEPRASAADGTVTEAEAVRAPAALLAAACPALGARLRSALLPGGEGVPGEGDRGLSAPCARRWPRAVQIRADPRVPRSALRCLFAHLATGSARLPLPLPLPPALALATERPAGAAPAAAASAAGEGAAAAAEESAVAATRKEVAALASALGLHHVRALARAAPPAPGSALPPPLPHLLSLRPRHILLAPTSDPPAPAPSAVGSAPALISDASGQHTRWGVGSDARAWHPPLEAQLEAVMRWEADQDMRGCPHDNAPSTSDSPPPGSLPRRPLVASSLLQGRQSPPPPRSRQRTPSDPDASSPWPADALLAVPLLRYGPAPTAAAAPPAGADGAPSGPGPPRDGPAVTTTCDEGGGGGGGRDGGGGGGGSACTDVGPLAVHAATALLPVHRVALAAGCEYFAALERWGAGADAEGPGPGPGPDGGPGPGPGPGPGGGVAWVLRAAGSVGGPPGTGGDGTPAKAAAEAAEAVGALAVAVLRAPACDAEAMAEVLRLLHDGEPAAAAAAESASGRGGGGGRALPLVATAWSRLACAGAAKEAEAEGPLSGPRPLPAARDSDALGCAAVCAACRELRLSVRAMQACGALLLPSLERHLAARVTALLHGRTHRRHHPESGSDRSGPTPQHPSASAPVDASAHSRHQGDGRQGGGRRASDGSSSDEAGADGGGGGRRGPLPAGCLLAVARDGAVLGLTWLAVEALEELVASHGSVEARASPEWEALPDALQRAALDGWARRARAASGQAAEPAAAVPAGVAAPSGRARVGWVPGVGVGEGSGVVLAQAVGLLAGTLG